MVNASQFVGRGEGAQILNEKLAFSPVTVVCEK